jgi:bifunctional DNA primase/polymerase-like protein
MRNVGRLWDRLHQKRLRRAAVRYTTHGWEVVPGAVRSSGRYRCEAGCPTRGVHPDWTDWEPTATTDPEWVTALWAFRPRAVLLATGRVFDVLEVPAFLGTAAVRGPGRGPVAVTGVGRWMFLVRPFAMLRPELATRPDVVLHGAGSWVPAPPTWTNEGPVRWLVDPEEVHWRLPDAVALQAKLTRALSVPPAPPLPWAA